MTYRCGSIIPLFAYSNKYSTNKNIGGDTQVTAPYSFFWFTLPTDVSADDVIRFRGSFKNNGNDWGLKLWLCPSAGYSSAYQTETFSVPTANASEFKVVEGSITPNSSVISAASGDNPIFLYMGGSQTSGTTSGYTSHGFTMWLERRT